MDSSGKHSKPACADSAKRLRRLPVGITNLPRDPKRRRMTDISGSQVQAIVRSLTRLGRRLGLTLGEYPLQEMAANDCSLSSSISGKHDTQHNSLIAHLRRLGLVTESNETCCYVELGAGTARFSDRLQEATDARHFHILVDRATFKKSRLRDAAMIQRSLKASSSDHGFASQTTRIKRLTLDICQLDIGATITDVCQNGREHDDSGTTIRMIALSKHLCGNATDHAIRKCQSVNQYGAAIAVAFTPCCHSLCNYLTYYHTPFMKACGIDAKGFETLACVSQWATLKLKSVHLEGDGHDTEPLILRRGFFEPLLSNERENRNSAGASYTDLRQSKKNNYTVFEGKRQCELLALSGEEFEEQLSRCEKQKLGRAAKACIDLGRACGMLQTGLWDEVHFIRYARPDITKESLLLVGLPCGQKEEK